MENQQDKILDFSSISQKQNQFYDISGGTFDFEEQSSTYLSEQQNYDLNENIKKELSQPCQKSQHNQYSVNNQNLNQEINLIQFPEGLNYEHSLISRSIIEESPQYLTEKDETNKENQADSQRVIMKKSKYKKTKYQAVFYNNAAPQKYIGMNKKFYLFLDQMIDLEYFENLQNPNNYIQNNWSVQLTKGFRFLNKVLHRMDNKFIEVEIEYLARQPQSIDYIIHVLQSLGNQDLIKYVNCLVEFQKNISSCQKLIYQQSLTLDFIENRLQREEAANEKFKQITSNLNPTKLIFYQRYSVDYETCQYESTIAGYSPALYEVLDNGSYHFKDHLLKNGYFDPMSPLFRLGDFFYRVCYFSSNIPKEINEEINTQATLDLITVDNYRFPVTMKLSHHYLEKDFDNENNLEFKFHDLLAIYEFNFKEQETYENLQRIRQKNILNSCNSETNFSDDTDWQQHDYVQTQLFQKHYQDQLQNLVKRGNKWNKICGFQEIPQKKVKHEH